MKLNNLLKGIAHEQVGDASHVEVLEVTSDSRKVSKGSLFIAIRGLLTDGHKYIDQAITHGAVAIICEELPTDRPKDVTFIRCEHTDVILGPLAANFYDHPSERLKLIGVTGTNGKTTTATLLYNLFRGLGHKAGLLSTVCIYIDDKKIETDRTTPDALTLQRILHEMVKEECEYAFMEVSSHAVCQHRIGGTVFTGGVFTNITRDHLDYHETFANYLKAKQGFFDALDKEAFALTNIDDSNGAVMTQNTSATVYGYALKRDTDFKGQIIEKHLEGTNMLFNGKEVFTHFVGDFNAYNLLAVYGTAMLLNADQAETLRIISTLIPVDGRFQTILSPRKYVAVIDYAHTPDALENVLTTLQNLLENSTGRLFTLVGCGGNRDRGKRPIMSAIGAKYSDLLILTSDNPREEDPDEILAEMKSGLSPDDLRYTLTISDRREAIRTACTMAQENDIILIAGKGHETYQEIKGIKHHFSDYEEVLKVVNEQNAV